MVMPAADPLALAASFADDLPPSPSVPVPGAASGPALASRPRANSSGFQWDAALIPFLKRVGIGHAIVASLIIVIGIGGFFSDTAAIAAALVGVVAMVGLVLAAKIWFVCIAFKESAIYGLGALFVPLFWSVCLVKKIGHSQLAFALLASALIPGVLTLGLVGLFSPQGKAASRARKNRSNVDKMIKLIRKHEEETPPAGDVKEVTYKVSRVESPSQFISDGDRGLSQFKGYVPGSLQHDSTRQVVEFQYRGDVGLAAKYRLYVSFKTNTILGSEVSDP